MNSSSTPSACMIRRTINRSAARLFGSPKLGPISSRVSERRRQLLNGSYLFLVQVSSPPPPPPLPLFVSGLLLSAGSSKARRFFLSVAAPTRAEANLGRAKQQEIGCQTGGQTQETRLTPSACQRSGGPATRDISRWPPFWAAQNFLGSLAATLSQSRDFQPRRKAKTSTTLSSGSKSFAHDNDAPVLRRALQAAAC